MSDSKLRFRLGLFVLGALVMLGGLVWLFGSAPSIFKNQHSYQVTFREAPGLSPGAAVRRSGVRVGEVKSVELDDLTGEVQVVLLIETKYTLRRNDRPTLVPALIGRESSIDLVPIKPPGPEADMAQMEPGDTLTGDCQVSMAGLLDQASDVVPTTQGAVEDARRVMKRLEDMAPLMEDAIKEYRDLARATRDSLPRLQGAVDEVSNGARTWNKFGDRLDVVVQTNQDRVNRAMETLNSALERITNTFGEDNQRNLAALLDNVRQGSENLQSLTKNTDDLMVESRQTVKKISDAVARADQAMDNLQDATKPLAERTSSVMKNLDEGTEKLNSLLTDMRDILKVVFSGDGTLRKLATDPDLYNNVDQAIITMNNLFPRLERILKDAEVFADKLARHPELIGGGGIINPEQRTQTMSLEGKSR